MYMNKTKRNLIIASAVVNLINITASLVLSIMLMLNQEAVIKFIEEAGIALYSVSFSTNIYYAVFSFAIGLVGSILLLFSVRSKGKYFRTAQGLYIAGLIIIIVCGGFLSWLLLFISMFIPDVIVMNTHSEVRREQRFEERQQQASDAAYEEKKKQIEDLKRMRDNGIITEEEYKQKLFELL